MAIKPKDMRLYELKAEMFAAAGHPIRLAIIDYLSAGPQCVCDITAHVGAGRPNVSRHLGVLDKAGVVARRKEGLRMIYSLATPCIVGFLDCVSSVLRERLAENTAVLRKL